MASTPTYKNLDTLIETPDSGLLELAERTTYTKIYEAKYSVCVASAVSKGTYGTGSLAGYRVGRCTVARTRGDMGRLTIVWDAGDGGGDSGFTLPADRYNVCPEDLSPRIERHPRYKSLGDQTVTYVEEGKYITVPVWAVIQNAASAATGNLRDAWIAVLNTCPDPALALNLLTKIERGNEVYYLAAIRYTWTIYCWEVPETTRGGFIEAPAGPLAGFFSPDIDWLRLGDTLDDGDGGIHALTRSWLGGPVGHWDAELYSVP